MQRQIMLRLSDVFVPLSLLQLPVLGRTAERSFSRRQHVAIEQRRSFRHSPALAARSHQRFTDRLT